jgi:phosphoadenosine phosphosulfate reductase
MYPNDFPVQEFFLNAELDAYKNKIQRSIEYIHKSFEITSDWYVAWSGGKDSTALAHLVTRLYPETEVWSEKDDCDFPGELEYVNIIAGKYLFNLKLTYNDSLWQAIQEQKIDICEDLHSRGTSFSDQFFYSEVAKQEKLHDGCFLGLRDEESKARRLNTYMRSGLYQKNNGKYTCNAIHHWSAVDVFSYLVSNEIPILDVYFKTKFIGHPTKIRKSWMLPSHQASRGYCAWLRYYYPDVFEKLKTLHPEVKSYV